MIILLGKSGSGKDTLLNYMVKNHGFNKIVTVTTRPKRNTETNNKDYIFTSDRIFRECVDDGLFAEHRVYYTSLGDWRYGSLKSSYLISSDKDMIILTPDGYLAVKSFLEKNNINVKVFYIKSDQEVRVKRVTERGDNEHEIIRRIQSDNVDFAGLDTKEMYIIENNNTVEDAVNNILKVLKSEGGI